MSQQSTWYHEVAMEAPGSTFQATESMEDERNRPRQADRFPFHKFFNKQEFFPLGSFNPIHNVTSFVIGNSGQVT